MKAWVLFIASTSYFAVLFVGSCWQEPVPVSILIWAAFISLTIVAGVIFRVARRSQETERYISDKAINKFGEPLAAKPSLPSRSSTRRDKLDA